MLLTISILKHHRDYRFPCSAIATADKCWSQGGWRERGREDFASTSLVSVSKNLKVKAVPHTAIQLLLRALLDQRQNCSYQYRGRNKKRIQTSDQSNVGRRATKQAFKLPRSPPYWWRPTLVQEHVTAYRVGRSSSTKSGLMLRFPRNPGPASVFCVFSLETATTKVPQGWATMLVGGIPWVTNSMYFVEWRRGILEWEEAAAQSKTGWGEGEEDSDSGLGKVLGGRQRLPLDPISHPGPESPTVHQSTRNCASNWAFRSEQIHSSCQGLT